MIRVTVCELHDEPSGLDRDWEALARHVASNASDLVLLPEMPFHRWLAASRTVDPSAWDRSVEDHERWLDRLGELGAAAVLTTRPTVEGGRRFNRAVAWSRERGLIDVAHRKRYLPDEDGFWEATWYHRGAPDDAPVDVLGVRVGFAICTEMWFYEIAREHARRGTHVLVCPRATPARTSDKWLAGGRAAAVVSGAYCLSSNFSDTSDGAGSWGGTGWVIEPEEGAVLTTTARGSRFRTVEIDPRAAEAAKRTYPRDVIDV